MSADRSGDAARRARIRWSGGAGAVGAGGGFVAGLTIAGHLTWPGVGAVATVAGVIVAATALVLQESDRRQNRRRADADRVTDEIARRRVGEVERARVVAEADAVDIISMGGGGWVQNGVVHSDAVMFLLTNGTTQPISRIGVELDPPVVRLSVRSGRRPTSLAPGAEERWTESTEEYLIPQSEASSNELRAYAAVATYALAGRTWSKRQGGSAELVVGTLPDI